MQLRHCEHGVRRGGLRTVQPGHDRRRHGPGRVHRLPAELLCEPHGPPRVLPLPSWGDVGAWGGGLLCRCELWPRPGARQRPVQRLPARPFLQRWHGVHRLRAGHECLAAGRHGMFALPCWHVQLRQRHPPLPALQFRHFRAGRGLHRVLRLRRWHHRRRPRPDCLHAVPGWLFRRAHRAPRVPPVRVRHRRGHLGVQRCVYQHHHNHYKQHLFKQLQLF